MQPIQVLVEQLFNWPKVNILKNFKKIKFILAFGLKSINLIRNRPDVETLKRELKEIGADYVFTEEEFKKEGRKLVASLGQKIKLACNGVG